MLGGFWQSVRSFVSRKFHNSGERPNRSWRAAPRGEWLERREMLSANQITYQPVLAAVVIEGTSGADSVSVSTNANSTISVSMQNSTGIQNVSFPIAGITEIRFIGGDGDDVFTNFSAIRTLALGEGG